MSATNVADPIKNGTDASFMADVVQASQEAPVLVDFWAPWCGPCRQLTPVLEKAVRASGGKVKLVKVNIDENPAIAGQLGVRSIPAVFAFDRGRPVDGFMGALPESQIKVFIDRLLGGGAEEEDGAADIESALKLAGEALAHGDFPQAAQVFAAVLEADPENVKALAGLARCFLAGGDPERAKEVLDSASEEAAKDPDLQAVRTALSLADEAKGVGDFAALERQLQANPEDHAVRYDIARLLAARGELSPAVDHLLFILQKDRAWNDEAARKFLLRIFEAAGPASDVAKVGRRKLSTVLFS